MTETKNLKLKTYETTTDGQELVARYIDNTSDNFQKIDEFCKTDTTLSVEGGIADAKTVGDNVSQLKDDISNVTNTTESPVSAGSVWASTDNGAGWIALHVGDGGETDYELIEKIIVGYSLTTEEPPDWSENYTSYFTNDGTPIEPVYTAITDPVAPKWERDKFYTYTDSGVLSISRTKYKNGDNYSLKHVSIYVKCTETMTYGVRCSVQFNNSAMYFNVGGFDSKATKYIFEAKNLGSHFRTLYSTNAPMSIVGIETKTYFNADLNYNLPIIGVIVVANRYSTIPSGSELFIYGVRK